MQNAKSYKATLAPAAETCGFRHCKNRAAIRLTSVERFKEAGKDHKISSDDYVCVDHLVEFYPQEAYQAYQEAVSPVAIGGTPDVQLKGAEEVAN